MSNLEIKAGQEPVTPTHKTLMLEYSTKLFNPDCLPHG
jgi:hypothetical protein